MTVTHSRQVRHCQTTVEGEEMSLRPLRLKMNQAMTCLVESTKYVVMYTNKCIHE